MTNTEISKDKFKKIIKDFLLPFFTGVEIKDFCSPPQRNKDELVTQLNKKSKSDLRLMPFEKATYCLNISRSQPFELEEKKLIDSFLRTAKRLYGIDKYAHQRDTALSVLTETIADYVLRDSSEFFFLLLSTLTQWSQETYEGQRIAFSIGIDAAENLQENKVKFIDIIEEDFLKTLSNGQDSLLILDKEGNILGHEHCNFSENKSSGYAPIRFVPIAQWTNLSTDRVAVSLNRNGEILIFKRGNLIFAKRRGYWRYFAHNAVIKKLTENAIAKKSNIDLRRELYLTALDVAFSRTGGCIGIFIKEKQGDGFLLIDDGDKLTSNSFVTFKQKTINTIINKEGRIKKFHDIDRFLRLELVSIDGATVLDYEGNILAIGAILKIKERSTAGGGRQAAAESLAKYGLGLKISNDGYIRAINRDGVTIFEIG